MAPQKRPSRSKPRTVKLNLGIYKAAAARAAAAEYSSFASFRFSARGRYLVVTVSPEEGSDPDSLVKEYLNSALAGSI